MKRIAVAVFCLAVLAGCDREGSDRASADLDLDAVQPLGHLGSPAPERFNVRLDTTKGEIVIAVHRDWAPRGAERFRTLVESGYYDDARFHRVIPDFIVQWGLAGDPAVTARWIENRIPDDSVVVSNTRGRIAFAFTEPGTRTTQVFISVVDNSRLDEQGFAPFGEVVEGMDVVDAIYSGYGEDSGGGVRRGDQSRIVAEGNAYLDAEFPLLDRLISATVETPPSSRSGPNRGPFSTGSGSHEDHSHAGRAIAPRTLLAGDRPQRPGVRFGPAADRSRWGGSQPRVGG